MALEVEQFARQTLSRDETDPRPVPAWYMQVVKDWVSAYPEEQEFLVEIIDQDLSVTCLKCFRDVSLGNDHELGLLPFKAHLAEAHKEPWHSAVSNASMPTSAPASTLNAASSTVPSSSSRIYSGKKRSSAAAAELADEISDSDINHKRARLSHGNDFEFFGGTRNDDNELSMSDHSATFSEPIDSHSAEHEAGPTIIRKKSRLLTTLQAYDSRDIKVKVEPENDNLGFALSRTDDPVASSSKVKSEDVEVKQSISLSLNSEGAPNDIFRNISNVRQNTRLSQDVKPDFKPDIHSKMSMTAPLSQIPVNATAVAPENAIRYAKSLHLIGMAGDAGIVNDEPLDDAPDARVAAAIAANATNAVDFFANDIINFGETATVKTALEKLCLPAIDRLLPGSTTQLYPHQFIGVAWMNELEKKPRHHGGILADDMGLGKTAQMIAAMLINRPPQGESRKSTLIVVPSSLVGQWKREIENMTEEDTFSIAIHHGTLKLKSVKAVSKYDIVITTLVDEDSRKIGPLAKTKWWRVILDEAQFVRNRNTVSSINVAALDSMHRWVLSGTPVTNSLVDLYSFVRFLRYNPWCEWESFYGSIARLEKRNPQRAGERAQAMLVPIILRRKKDTLLDGKPILQLGPKTIEIRRLTFTPRERQVYDALEKRQQDKLLRIIERGRVAKSYQFILAMICACVIADEFELGVLKTIENLGVNTDPEIVLGRATRLLGDDAVIELKKKFIVWAKDDDDLENSECCICLEPIINNLMVTKCHHRFCDTCIYDIFEMPGNAVHDDTGEARDRTEPVRPCPTCRTPLHEKEIFPAFPFEPTEEELEALEEADQQDDEEDSDVEFRRINKAKASRRVRGNDKGKGRTVERDGLVNGINLRELDAGNDFQPSTKMLEMVKFLKDIKANSPPDRPEKTIIYSQWTTMIDMVQEVLRREHMPNVRLDGSMERNARERVLDEFKSRVGPNIIIISLKCGGVGLNLTEANHVISLDLAWSPAQESQAFDRAHRLGQRKPVFVERLVIENTIEDRILDIQDRKQGLSDAALGEGRAKRQKRFSVAELRRLFGMD
ncbi:SNF2 family N-terminal domain-containing protein [Auriculariales sp. MPI-PUGE-AT-0066]|nr:SNF2 family N-terminal domain-containing protein [Auriculariales sp. MPI-PUGE-AT-0066]